MDRPGPTVLAPLPASPAGSAPTAGEAAVALGTSAFIDAWLGDHPGEPGPGVDELAAYAGYSRFHFSRMFSRTVGVSPGQYLAAVRFRRAKQLLLAGDDPVVDVCAAVGFTSLSTFTRQFRAAVGTTPAAFRRIAQAVADGPIPPFELTPDGAVPAVEVAMRLPTARYAGLRRTPLVWIGWFPSPAPIGLPLAGRVLEATDSLRLPLCPGAPWLLAFAVDPNAEAADHLAPQVPLVAVHRSPLTRAGRVTLDFAPALPPNVPLLPALPALVPGFDGSR